jgi:hypothetical protein
MTDHMSLDEILNQTFWGLDTISMLGDVEHFIEFSERNIAWQKRRELIRAKRECDEEEFDDPSIEAQYRDQMIEGVAYRFDVGLTQRVRYAGLTAVITTIEWCIVSLKKRASFKFPEHRPKNEAVHALAVFNEKACLRLHAKIEHLEAITQVRNCVVHAAGLLESYRHGAELRSRLPALQGVNASSINFLGESIEIEAGFLEGVVSDAKGWLPSVEKQVPQLGLLRE